MKQVTSTVSNLLPLLASQSGEEKLRIAFDLSAFVRKLRKEGEKYAEKSQRQRSGRAS